MWRQAVLAALAVLAVGAAGCGRELPDDAAPTTTQSEKEATDPFGEEELGALSGRIRIDGSSTLQPFAAAAAEEFRKEEPDVKISVGQSGTGGGFEKFCRGEIDIANASRPIDEEEKRVCEDKRIDYLELQVANDGVSVIVSRDNDWSDCLTVEQLKAIWEPGSKADSWTDVDDEYPDEKLRLSGPGTDSGTFDFFTETIVGEAGSSRSDYSPSENDNVIVQAVAGSAGGQGYLGLSYVEDNKGRIRPLALDDGEGCIEPSAETVQDGSYVLSRPLYAYVRADIVEEPHVDAFLNFVFDNQRRIAKRSLFVPLTEEQLNRARTIFEGGGLDVGTE